MRAKGQLDHFHFEGAGALNGTIDNAAAVDRTSSYDHTYYGYVGGVVDIPITSHGYTANSEKYPSLIYLQNTTNYDGIRKIVSIPDANTVRIVAAYVAETFAGTELYFPGVSLDEDYILEEFDIHLNTASATSENFTVDRDSIRGTEYDTNIFTEDFNTVKDYIKTYDDPSKKMDADDVVKVSWANSNSRTWGLEIRVRRLR